jgi:hypothetical protein
MVNTVKENHEGYTCQKFTIAKEARRAIRMVGNPSPKDFKYMVFLNLVLNCPVTPNDVTASDKICGPNVATLKGNTTHDTHDPVLTEYVKLPQEITYLNK